VAICGVFPTVGGNLPAAANSACRQYDRLAFENNKPATFPLVPKAPGDLVSLGQKPANRAFHVDVNALVNSAVLERAYHLETRTIANMRQPGIGMATKIPLHDPTLAGTIENGSPLFKFVYSLR
jgi:hypothetical protein